MTCANLLPFCGFLALVACGAQVQEALVFGGHQSLRPRANLGGIPRLLVIAIGMPVDGRPYDN